MALDAENTPTFGPEQIGVDQEGRSDVVNWAKQNLVAKTDLRFLRTVLLRLVDKADTTKRGFFDLAGLTTQTTRTLSFPDASGIIALTSQTDGSIDHGADLAGLTDDDHTQYALLLGRSGGQTLIGGTGSGDDLTLEGSSHATNGDVLIQPTDGNVGIGMTGTEAWHSTYLGVQLGGTGASLSTRAAGAGGQIQVMQNAYYDGSWKRIVADEASAYRQISGTHAFRIAGSDAADSVITFTDALTIDNSGNVSIGTTTSVSPLLVRQASASVPGIVIAGYSTGDANRAWISFRDSNGTTERGWVGDGSGSNDDIYLVSTTGDLHLGTASSSVVLNIQGTYVGVGAQLTPAGNIDNYKGARAAYTDITQYLQHNPYLISSAYSSSYYLGGLAWYTTNDNPTKPKAGIFISMTSSGTYMYFATSNSYATGMTNVSTGLDYNGNLSVNPNTDNYSTIGRAIIGYNGTHTDCATFAHYDQNSNTGFALYQNASGDTVLNSPVGRTIYLSFGGSSRVTMDQISTTGLVWRHTYSGVGGVITYVNGSITSTKVYPATAGYATRYIAFDGAVADTTSAVSNHPWGQLTSSGSSTNILSSGANLLTLKWETDGSISIQRTGGSLTYEVALTIWYI